jgi:thioredoxin reductase/NAD-dependent dihydropyrimidine dehydrogenase PreA subunit
MPLTRDLLLWAVYAAPLAAAFAVYARRRRMREARSKSILEHAIKSGLTEPPSLHPHIDPAICVGSGACTRACPEHTLGIIDGKAHLVNPTVCIGHGACAASCPMGAITLVFGTAKRGIDIPYVQPSFETNVPGIYIAGELGGMGLIRKAAEQGRQAMASIALKSIAGPSQDRLGPSGAGSAPGPSQGNANTCADSRAQGDALDASELDVVIVGAGPAGLSATLGAMEKKLRFVTLEQEDSLGGTVYHYPRNKVVMTQPVTLPLVGKITVGEISKESLIELWQGIVERVGMPIRFGERLEKIEPVEGGYLVKTQRSEYRARSLLLAIGRRGTPRKLGVPGEEHPKVVYRLIDPEQYRGRKVLVVGGGDSAIEAAVSIAEQPDTQVTLSYRGEAFGRVKSKNRERLAEAEQSGKLSVALGSQITRIDENWAAIERNGEKTMLENDYVLVCAGGVLPTPMLKEIGIRVETKFGSA